MSPRVSSVAARLLSDTYLQAQPGTYILVLAARTHTVVRIGRFGVLDVQPGWYFYVGSARGPGGVRARVAHHQVPTLRPHWHMDYLRTVTRLEAVWYIYDSVHWEHVWAEVLGQWPGVSVPLPGFGASDCACPSHLYFAPRRLAGRAIRHELQHAMPSYIGETAARSGCSRAHATRPQKG
ncbi:MAG: GIY-YIG nuclease family protein [Candidatus Tectomicrobia bacterium]|uniref:GIY-YIG nuclease family protein n=1 Tax=Tectimicrobiota bacterium TaxID=2528274 RepID=A0A938B5Z8_UNCTE|nr:GIY-YIG nuclease family protein [Candidatus Tectomicrobia bacterium]